MEPDENYHQYSVMTISEGEEIAGMYISPPVASIGTYKLLVKKRKDGKYEWAHFVQRDSGKKENVYRGELDRKEQIETLLAALNRALNIAYGVKVNLYPAKPTLMNQEGVEFDPKEN